MRLVTSGMVRTAIEDTLRPWIDWHLAEAERSEGVPVSSTDRPREWRLVLSRDGTLSHNQLPLVVITVGQWTPERHPEEIDGTFEVAVNAVVPGGGWEDTAARCGRYGAAVAATLEHQLPFHPLIADCMVRDIVTDLTPESSQRSRGEVVVTATVAVACVMPAVRELTVPPSSVAAPHLPPTADDVSVAVHPKES